MIIALTAAVGIEYVLSLVASYGIFPILFSLLLWFTIKNGREREQEMNTTLNDVNKNLVSCVVETKATVTELKNDVKDCKEDIAELKEGHSSIEKKIDILTIKVDRQ